MEKYAPLKAIDLSDDPKELHHEVLRLRDELFGAMAEVSRLKSEQLDNQRSGALREVAGLDKKVAYLEQLNCDLERQIVALRTSRSWKIGRAILSPLHFYRKLFRVNQ